MEILDLEKQVDRFLRDDIPLTVLTDNIYLTKHQWALLISKLRGYEELRRQDGFNDSVPAEYFEFAHEVPEEYPTSHEERRDLFVKLRELEQKVSEYEKEVRKYRTILYDIDEGLIEKISGLIKELDSGKTIEYSKLEELFNKNGLSLHKINFYEALYERYERATKKLEELEQKQEKYKEIEFEIEDIKKELIKTNIKLPNWVIRTFFRGISLPIEDTQQVAYRGLLSAIDHFDPKRGTAFSTFAVPVIIHEIERNFKELYGISWNDYMNMEKIASYRAGDQEEDIHEHTGLSKKQIDNLDSMVKETIPFSDVFPEEPTADRVTRYKLDNPLDGVDFIDIYSEGDLENIPDPAADAAVEEMELKELRELLEERIDRSLNEREKLVIELRFNFSGTQDHEYTLKEVGKILNLQTERVRQIEAKAIRKLRHPRNSRGLRDYHVSQPHSWLFRANNIDYDKIYKKLISLLSTDLSDESILIFMNMEGIHWDLIELYTQIDQINEITDLAVEKYEDGYNYYMIRNLVDSRYHVYLSSEFIAYLIHVYMKIDKKEDITENKKSI